MTLADNRQDAQNIAPPQDSLTGKILRVMTRAVLLLGFWAVLLGVVLRMAVGPELFDFSSPLSYENDGISHSVVIKSVMEEGWFPSFNSHLGAPFTASQYDYPGSDAVHYLLIKAIAIFTSDWAVVQNVYVLAGFLLCVLSGYAVLRYLKVWPTLAVSGALLFTLLPFHFLRTQHLFLASYFSVPIAIWLALETWRLGEDRTETGPRLRRAAQPLVVLGALVLGGSGVYYALFGIIIIAAGGLVAAISARSGRAAIPAIIAIAITVGTMAASVAPSVWYAFQEGPNPEAVKRHAVESERYGLTLTQLTFPRPMHRWKVAREFRARFDEFSNSNFETRSSSIGLIGTIGLIVLAGAAVRRFTSTNRAQTDLDRLAFIALVCFLIGTIGGAGAVFAWLITPIIRSYSRISVFIGFIALAASMCGLQRLLVRLAGRRAEVLRVAAISSALIVSVVGVLDQTVPGEYKREDTKAQFESDRSFIRQAEVVLPSGALIYQLPYHPYPEAGPVGRMADYDLLRGYLHSNRLRWSHGNMKGRPEDLWQRALSKRALPVQIEIARANGFLAFYVDRRAFPDHGAELEGVLKHWVGDPLLVSAHRDLALYGARNAQPEVTLVDGALRAVTEMIDLSAADLPQVALQGYGAAEAWGRWTVGGRATMVFLRPLPRYVRVRLDVLNAFGPNAGATIDVRVGREVKSFKAEGLPKSVFLDFGPLRNEHVLQLEIPKPTTPMSTGKSHDDRPLGIGVVRVQILPTSG